MYLFQDEGHKYLDTDNLLWKPISVTSLIDHYTDEFNEEFWLEYKAYQHYCIPDNQLISVGSVNRKAERKERYKAFLKYHKIAYWDHDNKKMINFFNELKTKLNIPTEAIESLIKELSTSWKDINTTACINGSEKHDIEEQASLLREHEHNPFDGKQYKVIKSYEMQVIDGKNTKVSIVDLNNLEPGFYTEIIVSVGDLIGQIDKLWITEDRGLFIRDIKTNKELKFVNTFSKMKAPLAGFDDCNYNHYLIQLNLYAYILNQYGYHTLGLALDYYKPIDIDDLNKGRVHEEYILEIVYKDVQNMVVDYSLKQSM